MKTFARVINFNVLACKLFKIIFLTETGGTTGSQPDSNLPVVFEATEDPTLTNLTKNDVNCDKTGTCYDGNALSIGRFAVR